MFIDILLLGVGLSMDAFAVSVSGGMICRTVTLKDTLKVSVTFGVFQAVMPLLGYMIGDLFNKYIDSFDHYIAFALLLLIGIKMIYEGIKNNGEKVNDQFFRFPNIMMLGIATSIDAFIAGLGLSMTETSIFPSVMIIGATTFIFCSIGIKLGCRLGRRIEKGADLLGGCILVILGIKTLLEGLGLF